MRKDRFDGEPALIATAVARKTGLMVRKEEQPGSGGAARTMRLDDMNVGRWAR